MNKIQVTAQQRANALDARDNMWPSVPEANVMPELASWRRGSDRGVKPNCGTVACFGGWCAWWPAFRAQGVQVDSCTGQPYAIGGPTGSVSLDLFGHYGMFYVSGANADTDYGFQGTDHELVTHRLNWLIENSEVVS